MWRDLGMGGLVLSLAAGCGSDSDGGGSAGESAATSNASLGCEGPSLGAGEHVIDIEHDGVPRQYTVYVPDSLADAPANLVLNFHGFTSDMDEQVLFSGLNAVADREGFVVAYPNGIDNSFNAGSCCAFTDQERDDVGFARAVVADVGRQLCIDEDRVFSTGMSNGGYMSFRLACEASDVFRAIAPVSSYLGVPMEACTDARPLPTIVFNGTEDTLVSYADGGRGNSHGSLPEMVEKWAGKNGCDSTPQVTYEEGTATCETFINCTAGATVTFCTLEGMGHCWPGQELCPFGDSTLDLSANDEMWKFFSAH